MRSHLVVLICLAGCFRVGFLGGDDDKHGSHASDDDTGGGGDGPGGDADGDSDVVCDSDCTQPSFSITGVLGGLDVTADDELTSGDTATVVWTAVPEASYFALSVRDAAGTGIICPEQYTAGNTTSHTFAACPLQTGTSYQVRVAAETGSGLFDAANDGFAFDVTSAPVAQLSRTPLYPLNGADFLEYVQNDGVDSFSASDAACVGDELGYDACIHGAERQRVVSTFDDCTDATAKDALDVFEWICRLETTAVYYSRGFLPGRGLKHLVDASGFLPNRVELWAGGAVVAATPSEVWWSNPVAVLPANSAATDPVLELDGADDDGAGPDQAYVPGTILVQSASGSSSGYNLAIDRLAVVVLPNATLTYSGNLANNCDTTGEIGTAGRCLLAAAGQDYLWIEGAFDGGIGTRTYNGARLIGMRFLRVHGASFNDNDGSGLSLGAFSSVVDEVVAANNLINGFALGTFGYSDVLLHRIDAFGNDEFGFTAMNQTRLLMYDARFADNGMGGMESNAGGNTFVHVTAYNNVDENLALAGGAGTNENMTMVDALAFNSGAAAIAVNSVSATVLGATIANAGYGLRAEAADETFARIAIVNTVESNLIGNRIRAANLAIDGGIMWLGDNSEYDYNLLVNAGTQCDASGATNSGLGHGTCAGQGASTATVRTGLDLGSSFAAKLTSDEATNASDTSGQRDYASITDWMGFDDHHRGWGLDGGVFPSASQQGRCSSGNCRVWDWRLVGTDTAIRNRTGDGASPNDAFSAGGPCPAAAGGDYTLDDRQVRSYDSRDNAVENIGDAMGDDDGTCESGEQCHNRFLVNATEIILDELGDDDGLCESQEACVYAPNFGAYQGSGDYLAGGSCQFQDGAVSGVTLYGYPDNGL